MIKLYLAIVVLSLTLLTLTQAQNTPADYLRAHNNARAQVNVGPIQWDANLAAFALSYANTLRGTCRLVHSGSRYGENLAGSSGDLSGTAAVKLWVDERQFYNYNQNTCASGEVCGHYTQVVWRNSVRFGCAKVVCNNGGTIISCNYDPPGNWVGQRPW